MEEIKKIKGKWNKVRRTAYPFEDVLGGYMAKVIQENCNGNSLLDLGCGEGFITKKLKKNFKTIIGVDGTKSQIDLAKKRNTNIEFIHCNIEDFKISKKFDCIILIGILEHVDDPNQLLNISKQFLKKDGVLHIQVPNGFSLNRRLGTKMQLLSKETDFHSHDVDLGHQRTFDLISLKTLIKKNKLKIINSGGFFLKAHPNHQMQILFDSNLWENKKTKEKYFDALFEIGKEIPEFASTLYVTCKK